MKKTNLNNIKKRFTTLIEPDLLTQIKLISFFTNQKLNESINDSFTLFIKDFETKNNISINSLIDIQSNFKPLTKNEDIDKN